MYAEYDEPEFEFTCYDGHNPIDREVYQIFLNIWENGKAFIEYWKACPLSNAKLPERKEEQVRKKARKEKSQDRRRAQTPRASQCVHKRMLQLAREEASGIHSYRREQG